MDVESRNKGWIIDLKIDARVPDLLQQGPFRTCTVLTVAYCVHTLLSYDLILGLDQRKVVEINRPAALCNLKEYSR